jgi:putative membrane protein
MAAPDPDAFDPDARRPAIGDPDLTDADIADVKRRTWLAAERTWLAWWRTGLGAAAVSIGVGRLLPGLTGGARWPLRLLGIGYGLVAIAVLVIGAIRQNHVASALRRGSYEELSSPLVMWLTAAAIALSIATLVVIAVAI